MITKDRPRTQARPPWCVAKQDDRSLDAARDHLLLAIAEADRFGFEGTKLALIKMLETLERK